MIRLIKILPFFFIGNVIGLMPKKLPNGKSKTFTPNLESPREDLQAISAGTALLISKNWMQNILLDVSMRYQIKQLNNNREFLYDDLHIMSGIQELQKNIELSQKKIYNSWTDVLNIGDTHTSPQIYLAWKPKSLQNINEVLFIVIAEIVKKINNENEEKFILQIKNVIQSPFWDEEQIPSVHLKNSIIDQNKYTNSTELSFDYLYETSLRYKLAWDTWFLELDSY